MNAALRPSRVFLLAGVALLAAGGCRGGAASSPVPAPIDQLLPCELRVHPFTGTRLFSDDGGIRGIDVRLEVLDAFGDATKAFGTFRFELFEFEPARADNKGQRLAFWSVPLLDVEANRRHWTAISRTYQFKLAWDQAVPVGRKFILQAIFESPYSERLFAERTFIAGQ